MAIEAASTIYELNQNLPLDADEQAEGDDHIRTIKAVLKATFPGLGGALGRVISKSIGFTPGVTENTCIFHCTAALTVSLPAVAGVPDGTYYLVNAFGGDLVIDPNGAELINGQATVTVLSGSWVVVGKLGGAWIALVTALPSAAVHAAPAKATPADADELLLVDSADTWKLKKFTWANIKTVLGSLYMALVAPGSSGNILTSNGTAWTSAAPPAAGVTSVNGNTGAVTAAQVAAAATAGYGYTPANPASLNAVSKDMGYNNVGSYCFVRHTTSINTITAGSTVAGSSLVPSGLALESGTETVKRSDNGAAALTGTWRIMGHWSNSLSPSSLEKQMGLAQRIS